MQNADDIYYSGIRKIFQLPSLSSVQKSELKTKFDKQKILVNKQKKDLFYYKARKFLRVTSQLTNYAVDILRTAIYILRSSSNA